MTRAPSAVSLTRRSVLLGLGASAASLGLPACTNSRSRLGTILGPGRYRTSPDGPLRYVLCLFDLDADRMRTVPMTFFGHGLAQHPQEPWRGVIFEKKGPGCCEVDLRAGQVLRPITTPPERAFYGHGAYSRDGAVLLATENRLETRTGLIAVRDAKTLKQIGEFPTYGKSPHDCQLVDEGRTLVITNGGGTLEDTSEEGAPSVSFVDVQSHKLLERLTFDQPRINAGHLSVLPGHDLVAISAPREGLPATERGGVTIRTDGGPFVTMTEPEAVVSRMVGESLSLCILRERQVVGVTNPDGNILTFWDMKAKQLVKSLELPAPRGIALTLDGSFLALSYGAGSLTLLSPQTLEPIERPRVPKSEISGSHIFPLDLATA